MTRIVLFAYACEPEEGSEPGAGWAWARLLANLGDVWVLTRSNNVDAIEAVRMSVPEADRIHVVPVDLPERWRRWKRGRRGIHLYYVLWQVAALRRARTLGVEWDLVWHVTMSNAWIGSLAWRIDAPFVYGPVGGAVTVPRAHLTSLGARGIAFEAARALARDAGRYLNPIARASWRRADLILTMNRETLGWFPARHRSKAVVLPHIIVAPEREPIETADRPPRVALFVGRLLPWKGGSLALRAIARLPGWSLIFCGRGPDEARLRALARTLGVEDRVRFLGHLARSEVLRLMREEATIFLFPSLREDGGWVISEAATRGLPVVCLDRGGPPLLGGTPVPVGGVEATVEALVRQVESLAGTVPSLPPVDLPSRLSQVTDALEERRLLRSTLTSSHGGGASSPDGGAADR